MKTEKQLYLICSNDKYETAYFCGTGSECAKVLGKSKSSMYSTIGKGCSIMGFFKLEKVKIDE